MSPRWITGQGWRRRKKWKERTRKRTRRYLVYKGRREERENKGKEREW